MTMTAAPEGVDVQPKLSEKLRALEVEMISAVSAFFPGVTPAVVENSGLGISTVSITFPADSVEQCFGFQTAQPLTVQLVERYDFPESEMIVWVGWSELGQQQDPLFRRVFGANFSGRNASEVPRLVNQVQLHLAETVRMGRRFHPRDGANGAIAAVSDGVTQRLTN